MGSYLPDEGLNLHVLHWKAALTPGPPGKPLRVTLKSLRFIRGTQQRVCLCVDRGLCEGSLDHLGMELLLTSFLPSPGRGGRAVSVGRSTTSRASPARQQLSKCPGQEGRTREGFREASAVTSRVRGEVPVFDHSDFRSPLLSVKPRAQDLAFRGPRNASDPASHSHPG